MRLSWITASIILVLSSFYTCFKLTQFLPNQKILALLLTLLLFIIMIGWEFIYRNDVSVANNFYFRTLALVGSTLFGVWTTFILFSIIADLGHFIVLWFMTLVNSTSLNQLHNSATSQWISIVILIISLFISGFGLKTALSGPKIVEVFVTVKEKLAALQKIKIAQISDLHVGVMIRRDYVEKVVRKINGLKVDLIVLTGDVADGTAKCTVDQLKPLADLKAPLGKFYVTGNHEYYWGAEEWVKSMRELGFIPLINENRVVNFAGIKILIAGVTDVSAKQFLSSHKTDLQKAIFSNEQSDFKILLSHNPSTFCDAGYAGFDLQLSGHTHAGQFFPFSLLVPLVHKHHKGLNCHNKSWLYINAGTGSWGPINRFGNPCEITVIRFKT